MKLFSYFALGRHHRGRTITHYRYDDLIHFLFHLHYLFLLLFLYNDFFFHLRSHHFHFLTHFCLLGHLSMVSFGVGLSVFQERVSNLSTMVSHGPIHHSFLVLTRASLLFVRSLVLYAFFRRVVGHDVY